MANDTIFNSSPANNRYNKIIYLDVNTDYKLSLHPLLISNVIAVVNQLFNLFFTVIGTRHFEPTFGIGLENQVFDLPLEIAQYVSKTDIFSALTTFMPYITVDLRNTNVVFNNSQGEVGITVAFSINGLPQSNIVLDFIFPA